MSYIKRLIISKYGYYYCKIYWPHNFETATMLELLDSSLSMVCDSMLYLLRTSQSMAESSVNFRKIVKHPISGKSNDITSRD